MKSLTLLTVDSGMKSYFTYRCSMAQRDEKLNFTYRCSMAQRDEKLNFTYRCSMAQRDEKLNGTAGLLYLPLFNGTAG